MKTDKSSRFVATTEENYIEMGSVNTSNDTPITRREISYNEKISSPPEENHSDQPLGTRVTSTCKRKEPPTIHSVVRKRLKSKVKKPAPLDLNISKWWRMVERENSFRLLTINHPGRPKRKMTMDWKLGIYPCGG